MFRAIVSSVHSSQELLLTIVKLIMLASNDSGYGQGDNFAELVFFERVDNILPIPGVGPIKSPAPTLRINSCEIARDVPVSPSGY